MNIGNVGKLTEALMQLEAKELSKLTSGMKKEFKSNEDAVSAAKGLSGLFKGLESALGDLSGAMNNILKASAAKPKSPPADQKKLVKDVKKMMETMQAGRIKFLETQIAEAEKKLEDLRKALASAKSAKPNGWFM